MASGTIKKIKSGYFSADVVVGENTITASNISSGSLPTDMIHSVYNVAGFITDRFFAEVHPLSTNNGVIIVTDTAQKLTVRWTELF